MPIDRPEAAPYDPENVSHVAWLILWLQSQEQIADVTEVLEFLENRTHPTYTREFFVSMFPEAVEAANKREAVTE